MDIRWIFSFSQKNLNSKVWLKNQNSTLLLCRTILKFSFCFEVIFGGVNSDNYKKGRTLCLFFCSLEISFEKDTLWYFFLLWSKFKHPVGCLAVLLFSSLTLWFYFFFQPDPVCSRSEKHSVEKEYHSCGSRGEVYNQRWAFF